ncbi:MAG: hypothetical protein ACXADW_12190 [Candidatus Hodarchaeales archaeon]|jgi:hypothetical protein
MKGTVPTLRLKIWDSTDYKGSHLNNVSSRLKVLEELHRLKEKLSSTPFPFCELDCPFLTVCLDSCTSECILSQLISLNTESPRDLEDERMTRVQWN